MYSYQDSDDRVPIVQMNSELEHAQLELVSARCAVHHLRLHYSADDLARFGRRDILRKSAQAASDLSEFYASIEEKISPPSDNLESSLPLGACQIAQAIECVSSYLRQQRDQYLPAGLPPAFYAEARAQGFDNLPEVIHMDSLTFVDVLVFNETLTQRALFHALVHAVQFRILGLDRYTELFVESFMRTKAHFTVPLEAHAFALTSRFMRPSPEAFSVEDHVVRWIVDGRY